MDTLEIRFKQLEVAKQVLLDIVANQKYSEDRLEAALAKEALDKIAKLETERFK